MRVLTFPWFCNLFKNQINPKNTSFWDIFEFEELWPTVAQLINTDVLMQCM